MSEVKRYNPELEKDIGLGLPCLSMMSNPYGEWVKWEDYAALALDLVRAQRDLEIDRRDKYDADKAELYAEVYRLREEIKGPEGFDSWKDAAVYLKASKTNRAAKRIDYLTAMAAHHSNEWHKMGPITGYMEGWNDCLAETRPASAADLTELVPDEKPADSSDGNDTEAWFDEGWNACRAAILRKIEEAK